jgi:hypothetical protein
MVSVNSNDVGVIAGGEKGKAKGKRHQANTEKPPFWSSSTTGVVGAS